MKTALLLRKAEALLANRLEDLETQLQAGEEGLWSEFLQVTATLTNLRLALTPEHGGSLLTTAEMASRLGVSSKTLLRHKKEKRIQPAVKNGKLLRWSGQERLS